MHWIGSISRCDGGGIETRFGARGCGEIFRKIFRKKFVENSANIYACLSNLARKPKCIKNSPDTCPGSFTFISFKSK